MACGEVGWVVNFLDYQSEFNAQNLTQLTHLLETWGVTAPPRLERRGKQDCLERFVLNRFFKYQLKNFLFDFPITVSKGENPDFMISIGNRKVGVEVGEACDPREQTEWTENEKRACETDEFAIRNIDLMNPDRSKQFSEILNQAILKKCIKASDLCDELLLYSNTDSDSFEDADWKLAALSSLPDCMARFSKVWLLSGKDLIELRERKVHVRDATDFYG